MYIPGTRFEIVLPIKIGDEVYESGLQGEIIEPIAKMVGKSYKVKFQDGRVTQIHNVVMNNQTQVLESK